MKSTIALSMHKAGSTVADRIFANIAKDRGYEIDLISAQVSASPLSEPEYYRAYQDLMKTDGVYYGMVRHHMNHDLEILPRLRVLVQVRDPRDCITSMYYSLTKSHVAPQDPAKREAFEKRRAQFQDVSIDTWAVRNARSYLMRLEKLNAVIETHPAVQLLTYEEMVQDTRAWLDKVLGFFDQPLTPQLQRRLEPYLDFSVSVEDASRHKRQVTPGDHVRKLKPDTIEKMNDILAPMMRNFRYSV